MIFINKHGYKKKCYICKKEFNYFGKYKEGNRNVSDFMKKLEMVGSDLENYSCIFCGCNDRERHLFMYFDRLQIWEIIAKSRVLHFAPEKKMANKIMNIKPIQYIMADLLPKREGILKIDATDIPYPDNSFDFILCNHVLEHIPDYKKAIYEMYRVLSFGGKAVIQTPFSKLLQNNFEDQGIKTNEHRLFFYGEADHQRIFSESQFTQDLISVGFEVEKIKNSSLFDIKTSTYFGINSNEDLIVLTK